MRRLLIDILIKHVGIVQDMYVHANTLTWNIVIKIYWLCIIPGGQKGDPGFPGQPGLSGPRGPPGKLLHVQKSAKSSVIVPFFPSCLYDQYYLKLYPKALNSHLNYMIIKILLINFC